MQFRAGQKASGADIRLSVEEGDRQIPYSSPVRILRRNQTIAHPPLGFPLGGLQHRKKILFILMVVPGRRLRGDRTEQAFEIERIQFFGPKASGQRKARTVNKLPIAQEYEPCKVAMAHLAVHAELMRGAASVLLGTTEC